MYDMMIVSFYSTKRSWPKGSVEVVPNIKETFCKPHDLQPLETRTS